MGCSSCGTASGGKPSGCKSNGGCSTGGCNRLNVHNWLNTLPLYDSAKVYPIIEVSFNKGSRKEFFRNNTHHILEKNDWITVEGVSGYDVGQVSLTGELVKLQLKKYSTTENGVVKRVLHMTTEEELNQCMAQKDREPEVLIRSRAIASSLNLAMKLCEVEIQADGKKGTFFYTADQRVDFRELIKLFANDFKLKVEMRQIGARQESGKVGGIGSCGRELCCSTWLTDFKSVNTTAARYQNLSINQTKLSGQCGRLKCCLNYELDTYMDALSVFPDHAENLETTKGIAHLQKRDIFKNLMWYSFSDNNKQYPLTITRVKEIQKMNKLGQKADDLQPVELEVKMEKGIPKVDMGFVNDVGQITLKALEKNKGKKSGNKGNNSGGKQQGGKPQNNRPQGEGNPAQQRNRPNRPERPQGNAPATNADGTPAQAQQNQNRGNRPNREPRLPQLNADGTPMAPQPQQNKVNRPNREPRPPQLNADGTPMAPQQQQNKGNRPNREPRPPRENVPPNADGTPGAPQQQQNRNNRPNREPRPQQGSGEPNADGTPSAPQQQQNRGNRPNREPRPQGPRPNQNPDAQQGGDANNEGNAQGQRPQQQNRPKQQQRQGPPRQKPPQEPPAPSV